jgi:serine/threonine-protein kinase
VDRSTDPLIGKTIGKYEILSVLGGGGMGTVYRARQAVVNREVAIKIINVDLKGSEQFIKRFRREAEAIAALEHPHIIGIIDYGQQEDLTYLVMALKLGGSLADLIKKERLALPEVYRIVSEIAQALDYAHLRGIIHRDLKPGNVLLDEERNTFLTDFGIARKVGETKLTAQGMVVGSPVYMAPESWKGEEASAETDVYSLGVILFEMLTGQAPYVDKAPARLMLKHISDPIPSVLTLRPDLPPQIDTVMAQALAKERSQRFGSAVALANMLKSALSMAATRTSAPRPQRPSEDTNVISKPASNRTPTPQPAPAPAPNRTPTPQPAPAPNRTPTPQPRYVAPVPASVAQPKPPTQSQPTATQGLDSTRLLLIGMGVIILLLVVLIVVLLISR